jgi:hypothetical protein
MNEPQRDKTKPDRFNKSPIVSTKAVSSQQKPYRLNKSRIVSTKDPSPRPKKVVIGACAPIHPRVGQSGPPGFHPGGLALVAPPKTTAAPRGDSSASR